MTIDLAIWLLLVAGVSAVAFGTTGSPYRSRLKALKIEARGMVSAYSAGLIYGPWVANRAAEFPEAWQERVKRELCATFKAEMIRQGVWEQHKVIAAALNVIIKE